MSSKIFKPYHELDNEFKKSMTNIIWYNTKQECINKGVYNMWIYINRPISNDLFSNDFEYLVKIETINKLGEYKVYIGLVQSVNNSNVVLKCFILELDLSFKERKIIYIDKSEVTDWYILNSCYSKLRYDY